VVTIPDFHFGQGQEIPADVGQFRLYTSLGQPALQLQDHRQERSEGGGYYVVDHRKRTLIAGLIDARAVTKWAGLPLSGFSATVARGKFPLKT
jgi:hypothetical protein